MPHFSTNFVVPFTVPLQRHQLLLCSVGNRTHCTVSPFEFNDVPGASGDTPTAGGFGVYSVFVKTVVVQLGAVPSVPFLPILTNGPCHPENGKLG